METSGQNKAVGVQSIKYVGHKEAVQHPTDGPTYVFRRGAAVQVPAKVADGLLKQPEKFLVATAEDIAAAKKAKEEAAKPKPPAGPVAPKEK